MFRSFFVLKSLSCVRVPAHAQLCQCMCACPDGRVCQRTYASASVRKLLHARMYSVHMLVLLPTCHSVQAEAHSHRAHLCDPRVREEKRAENQSLAGKPRESISAVSDRKRRASHRLGTDSGDEARLSSLQHAKRRTSMGMWAPSG